MWKLGVWAWAWVWAAAVASGVELRCASTGCGRVVGRRTDNEYEFSATDSNLKMLISYVDDKYLQVRCNGWEALDSAALPRFSSELLVPAVTLDSCPPPKGNRSFADVLADLNVALLHTQTQGSLSLNYLPPRPQLKEHHFINLTLVQLKITVNAQNTIIRPAPAVGFLDQLKTLRILDVLNVHLPAGALQQLPSLRQLTLRNTDIEGLSEALLTLQKLESLTLDENGLVNFTIPSNLKWLSLKSGMSTSQLFNRVSNAGAKNAAPALEVLKLVKWAVAKPDAMESNLCEALQMMDLQSPAVKVLPARWVPCSNLTTLQITSAKQLTSLPSRLFEGASALTKLHLTRGVLKTLPEDLLRHVPKLHTLDLRDNELLTLVSSTFAGPRALRRLYLSRNRLAGAALRALSPLRALAELKLEDNALGDVCALGDAPGYSPLSNMTDLTALYLTRTNITRICNDWRVKMVHLETLDLQKTQIAELTSADLQFARNIADSHVYLQGANITTVIYSKEDVNNTNLFNVTVHLKTNHLNCDCRMYWTRLALENKQKAPKVYGLYCNRTRLSDIDPEQFVCAAEEACAAAGLRGACACWRRPGGDAHGRALLHVRCEHAALRRVPPLRDQRVVYDLWLAHNHISELGAADLPPHWRHLDISHNSLKAVDEKTATALASGRRLNLSDNPLDCDCSVAPLLDNLRNHRGVNLSNITCTNGVALASVQTAHCHVRMPLAGWLAGALAALLLVAAAAVLACLAPPSWWLIIKVLLRRWGCLCWWRWWCCRTMEPNDGRQFDAFVSFSHKDEEIVRLIEARLEGGETPYRLCLHYRDWIPGLLISEQIVHSVRRSRRTVVLVSRDFLDSEWARAEFREAYSDALSDVTPRLVVVLLEDLAELPLDAELRRYLETNTYLRWGDPWFWDKLQLALPAPRPREAHSRVVPSSIAAATAPSAPPAAPAAAPSDTSSALLASSSALSVERQIPDSRLLDSIASSSISTNGSAAATVPAPLSPPAAGSPSPLPPASARGRVAPVPPAPALHVSFSRAVAAAT